MLKHHIRRQLLVASVAVIGLIGSMGLSHAQSKPPIKIGFGMAPKIGEVMADLILDGVDHIPNDFRARASLESEKEQIFE